MSFALYTDEDECDFIDTDWLENSDDEDIIGRWLETEDGKLFEVEKINNDIVFGREIVESDIHLRYGKEIAVSKDKIIYDE